MIIQKYNLLNEKDACISCQYAKWRTSERRNPNIIHPEIYPLYTKNDDLFCFCTQIMRYITYRCDQCDSHKLSTLLGGDSD